NSSPKVRILSQVFSYSHHRTTSFPALIETGWLLAAALYFLQRRQKTNGHRTTSICSSLQLPSTDHWAKLPLI
ncbi:hypothetical protein LEMLEM_LOCUS7204, partial [Lemmus lemmus]